MAEKKVKTVKEEKTTKKTNLIGMDRAALESRGVELKKRAMELRFEHASGQLPKTHVIRQNRRDIARVKTALRASADAN